MSSLDSSQSARRVLRARVLKCREVAPRHFHFQLHAPTLARDAAPGQFVHVATRPNSTTWNFDPLLRRAFSIMNADRENQSVEMLFRVEGQGTTALAAAKEGDELDIIGPLGQTFDLSPFHVKQSNVVLPRAILVGGGVGVPPLVFLGKILRATKIRVSALIGARTSQDVLGLDTFRALNIESTVATDDGSAGHHGRVIDLLEAELTTDNKAIVYACGPWPMLRAVALLCQKQGVRCQVSLEEAMPCGIGVCNGCVVRATQPHAMGATPPQLNEIIGDEWSPYQRYRRICVEGPACWADEIEWEQL